ncbi:CcmD family protein [Candidatus Kryptobacter tengchongensis]|uniref:CcmD family protein n=1 Tax=Kryptobacter tengchongensis TaxID=1643429 RepID=A0A656CY96_KRYT1|nr:CcmD family protein [Candidatus Kryptobacter tengchongensis]CUS86349.1 CcmD family protein [Candidatus Kryptobacter tengchongensis]CUS95798.1 CcmD family protein [Candidatus Kryptobacter tengchongensis]CUT04470.1 CcmD family protein [Candidatus Kryptobacter tengchongensis]CUU09441.1 CcmD family protein [Candidatus Kryptobacter tengchongensis]
MSIYEFLEKNSIYLVLIIALIVWLFVFAYLIRVDVKLKKLEDEFSKLENKEEVER